MGRDRDKKEGPRGGTKHQPGKGHDTKSGPSRKKRFARKAAKNRREKEEQAKKAWDEWDRLSDEVRKLLGPDGQPKVRRPES